jgi:2-oxo-3-hexenedioate decarboxylase
VTEWTVDPGLDLGTAYRVQQRLIDRKIAAGETIVGVKLGLTSRAKQQRMGIESPLTAWLTDSMALRVGEPLDPTPLIHPRVEPEIAFVLGQRLSGPGVTAERAMAAVSEVRAGLEIIDSRYADFRFTLPDVVSDPGCGASRRSRGKWRRPPVRHSPRSRASNSPPGRTRYR